MERTHGKTNLVKGGYPESSACRDLLGQWFRLTFCRRAKEMFFGLRLMQEDKNRRNVAPAVGVKLSTRMLSEAPSGALSFGDSWNLRMQGSRFKRTRFNYRKGLGSRIKDAIKTSLGKLSFHVKHGTSDASLVGSRL